MHISTFDFFPLPKLNCVLNLYPLPLNMFECAVWYLLNNGDKFMCEVYIMIMVKVLGICVVVKSIETNKRNKLGLSCAKLMTNLNYLKKRPVLDLIL